MEGEGGRVGGPSLVLCYVMSLVCVCISHTAHTHTCLVESITILHEGDPPSHTHTHTHTHT